jgi:hypothetical protein
MEVKFLAQLDVEERAGDYWQVLKDFPCKCDDQLVAVPAGFVTNFASVPRVPIAYLLAGGIGNRSATLHDYLYTQGKFPRAWCDSAFLGALATEGVSWWRRTAMYAAVRAAGGAHYGNQVPT